MESKNKEIKDVLKALFVLSSFVIERSKDGLGIDDALALVSKFQSDEEFSKKIRLAIDEIGKVPKEVSDLSLSDALDIIVAIVPDVMDLVSKVSKVSQA